MKMNCSECNVSIDADAQKYVLFKSGKVNVVCEECSTKESEPICFECRKKLVPNDPEQPIVVSKEHGMTTVCRECCNKQGIKVQSLKKPSSSKFSIVAVLKSIPQVFGIVSGFPTIAEGVNILRNGNDTREDNLKGWVSIILGSLLVLLWVGGIFSAYYFISKVF